jgi:DNA-binding GntR family transcriptional regulator
LIARNAKKARAAMVKHIRSSTESLARFIEASDVR